MYPLDLCDRLRPLVADRILQDLSNGCAPRLLAPCTGRAITAVRWLPATGEVLLMLEPPRLPDEPRGLALPAREVERLEVKRRGRGQPFRVLLRLADHTITLWLSELEGRARYP